MLESIISPPLSSGHSGVGIGVSTISETSAPNNKENTLNNSFNYMFNNELSKHSDSLHHAHKGGLTSNEIPTDSIDRVVAAETVVLETGAIGDYLRQLQRLASQLVNDTSGGKPLPGLTDLAAAIGELEADLTEFATRLTSTIENGSDATETASFVSLLGEVNGALAAISQVEFKDFDTQLAHFDDSTGSSSGLPAVESQAVENNRTFSNNVESLALARTVHGDNGFLPGTVSDAVPFAVQGKTEPVNAHTGARVTMTTAEVSQTIEQLQIRLASIQRLGNELATQVMQRAGADGGNFTEGASNGVVASLEHTLDGLGRRASSWFNQLQAGAQAIGGLASPRADNFISTSNALVSPLNYMSDLGAIDSIMAGQSTMVAETSSLIRGLPSNTLNTGLASPVVIASSHSAASTLNADAASFMTEISLPLNSSRWGEQFAQRLGWIATQGIKTAELQLNPAELGPIHIRIDSGEENARVLITTQHAATREVIEQQVSKLKDMFSAQGMELIDVDVDSQEQGMWSGSDGQRDNDADSVANIADDQSSNPSSTLLANESVSHSAHSVLLGFQRVDAYV